MSEGVKCIKRKRHEHFCLSHVLIAETVPEKSFKDKAQNVGFQQTEILDFELPLKELLENQQAS